jgi:hypothetical protein
VPLAPSPNPPSEVGEGGGDSLDGFFEPFRRKGNNWYKKLKIVIIGDIFLDKERALCVSFLSTFFS